MHLPLSLSLLFLSSSVLAQGDPSCQANYIVEACLGTENGKLATCGTNDYNCRCAAFANILTCFNNCPNDPRKSDYAGQQTIFCGYASQFPSSTPSAFSAPATGSPAAPTGTGSSGTGTGSGSGGSAQPTTTGPAGATETNGAAAMEMAMNVGGVLAGVAGVVVALL